MKLVRRSSFAFGLLAAVALFAGCQRSTQVELPVEAVFEGVRTYVWSGDVPELVRVGSPAGQTELETLLRSEIDAALTSKGFLRASAAADARFHAAIYLGIEKDTRTSDPLFTVYPAERIERGHATMTLTEVPAEGPTDGPAWTATTSIVLRVTERGMGQAELRWKATDETPDWQVLYLGAELGRRLP